MKSGKRNVSTFLGLEMGAIKNAARLVEGLCGVRVRRGLFRSGEKMSS